MSNEKSPLMLRKKISALNVFLLKLEHHREQADSISDVMYRLIRAEATLHKQDLQKALDQIEGK